MERTSFFRRRAVAPVLQLLRYGATPERLAWSLAVGLVIGVNPLLGSTTLLALIVAPLFRLNVMASQLGNHLMYPLELLLFPVFMRLGSMLFHTAGLPLERGEIVKAVKLHPWATTRLLWSWEWHALVVWGMFAVVTVPVLRIVLRPVLARMLDALHHEPVVEK